MARIYYPRARAILSVVFDGFGPTARDTPPKIIPVLPRQVTVTRNSYDQADGWELVFDAYDLPIDPQMIRAGAAEVFLYAAERAVGQDRLVDRRFDNLRGAPAQRAPGELVAQELGAGAIERFTEGNRPMVAGTFDEAAVELSSSGQWMTITGQDYTAYLIGKQWPPTEQGTARRIPLGKRLDVLLGEILAEADDTGRLAIRVEGIDPAKLPIVQAQTAAQGRGIAVEQDTSYWDVIYKLAVRHGFIAFVRGVDVVIAPPKNLDSHGDARIRRMAWGKNLEALEMTRRLGKEQAPAIVIKAYNPGDREPITVDYPPGTFTKIRETTRTSKKGKTSKTIKRTDEYRVIPVYGVSNRETLERMAASLHEQLGRAERSVRFSTRDLTDLADRDLMDLAAGDAVQISFEEFNVDRALLVNDAVATEVKVEHMVARGYGRAVAKVIAEKYQELKAIKGPLRVREVTYEYSLDNGISIEAELLDFVVAEGARDAEVRQPAASRRRRRADGSEVGLTPAQEAANQRQHGGT